MSTLTHLTLSPVLIVSVAGWKALRLIWTVRVAVDDEVAGGAPQIPRIDQETSDYVAAVSDHLPVVLDLHFKP